MSKLKAVIFDLDGVLVDTAEFHYLGWKKLADELGVPFDKNKNEDLKGIDRINSLKRMLGKKQHDYTEEELWDLATRKNEYYKRMIEQITPHNLFEGAYALILELRREDIKVAVASASKNAKTVIENLEIGNLLDEIVDGHDFEKGKPDPEIFLTAAERLGVSADEAIVVEDAEAGVEAGKAAGMVTVGLGDPHILGGADIVIQTLPELSADRLKSLVEKE
jgi:beta-phosphoglucomutase